MDSASKRVIIDGVEYEQVVNEIDPPIGSGSPDLPQGEVLPSEAPVDAPLGNVEPWWSFIKATRFWVMIGGAFSIYAETKGWIGEPERNLIATISAIFITVSTLDRSAEKMGK